MRGENLIKEEKEMKRITYIDVLLNMHTRVANRFWWIFPRGGEENLIRGESRYVVK